MQFTVCNFTVQEKIRWVWFSHIKFALNPFNPSFEVQNIDDVICACRNQLDIASPVQQLDTRLVHKRRVSRPANGLQWHSSFDSM